MGRLLIWIGLICAVYWLWRRATRPAPAAPGVEEAQPMVRCAHCGVHTPRAHALSQDQQWFCSQVHLEQGATRSDR
ncbi:MAG: PP0621 family protein [Pseudomonas sp.]|uniref:PP0621 family protein n=1 Tax=Pseudomonas sp. TaxID=306 RepID=UPI0030F012FC